MSGGIGGSALAAVIGVALLAGCVGEQATEATPSPTTFTASPLGSAYSLLALGQAEQAQINADAERLIAACMKEQGFAYDQVHVPDRLVLDPETDPADHAAQFGYGVVDSARAALASDDHDAPRSAAEQSAYDRALYGDGADHVDEDSAVAYDWRTQGCLGSAYHEATDGADELMADPRFAALFAALAQVEAAVAESAEVADLARAWAACMADAGHPDLEAPEDAVLSIREGLADISTQVEEDPDRALDALRRREIDTALADLACQGSTDHTSRYEQILWAAHAELAEELGPDLAALAEAEAGRPGSEG